ncbi:trypsin-1-like [Bradysia coprophila]|uniref:trypsin-1-like n=1 Tax=Bradysia coprophila TaxID=38358 RepID=UPI00187DD07A|nr:trypsin-1-like [Bradysia coprophila]
MKSFIAGLFLMVIAETITTTLAVAGGTTAAAGQFPYQVSLRNTDFGHICGGVIVSRNLVITAGACTDPISPIIDTVVAGSLKRTEDVLWQQTSGVNRTVVHPEYDGSTMDNDLSLLFLSEPFEFNDNVSSIALPSVGVETYPKSVILSGWGNVQYGEPMFEDLQYVELDTYSDANCEAIVGQYVRPEILCVGGDEGGRGGCQGDAGSPLVTHGENIYVSAVSSHFPCSGDCCSIPGPNGQCTELSYYVEWILKQSELYGGGLDSGASGLVLTSGFYLVLTLSLVYVRVVLVL